jgi:hypothetical protein
VASVQFAADIYLPIHALVEMAAIVVSFAVFAVYWNIWQANPSKGDSRGLMIGVAFFAVAILNVLHVFSFPGMPSFFTPSSTEKAIDFFLWGRLWTVAALLFAALMPTNTTHWALKPMPLFVFNLAIAGIAFVVITFFSWIIPPLWVPNQGLTLLKILLEYCVIGIAAITAFVYARDYRRTGNELSQYLSIGLIVLMLGEAFLTFYYNAYDIYNLFGHLAAVVAFAYIFQGLFVTAIHRPYAELAQANLALDAKAQELAGLYRRN